MYLKDSLSVSYVDFQNRVKCIERKINTNKPDVTNVL